MSILYHSTRGQAPELDIRGVTLTGLAVDGGLYVPKNWPTFTMADIASMKDQSYLAIAHKILTPFVDPVIPEKVLYDLLRQAYASFDTESITPLHQINDRHWMLELFHGPTLAFKDVALQLLGHVFDYFLEQGSQRMTVVGATSGDTGSAAIMALAGRKNIDVFILYPDQGPSDIQRRQMTCVDASNIHAVAIEGSFDDCQAIVKALFNDPVIRARYNLAAVNSINWLRIMAQMVYYFVAVARIGFAHPVSFVVPTGNFGNVYAAYCAIKCGLPVAKLVVASNRNDILPRFFKSGHMKTEGVQATLSPSMDIQISSNFERLLFDMCGQDPLQVCRLMNEMKTSGVFNVRPQQLAVAHKIFMAESIDDTQTLQTISNVYQETGYILDPHSAVGVAAARLLDQHLSPPIVTLACAHPAKFPDTVRRATGLTPVLPPAIAMLLQKPERTTLLPPRVEAVEHFMAERGHS